MRRTGLVGIGIWAGGAGGGGGGAADVALMVDVLVAAAEHPATRESTRSHPTILFGSCAKNPRVLDGKRSSLLCRLDFYVYLNVTQILCACIFKQQTYGGVELVATFGTNRHRKSEGSFTILLSDLLLPSRYFFLS
jgi:hypothetical protein